MRPLADLSHVMLYDLTVHGVLGYCKALLATAQRAPRRAAIFITLQGRHSGVTGVLG